MLHQRCGVELDRAGRVMVDATLNVPGYPDIYVVGDLAHVKQASGAMVPGVAPAAMQMGRFAAQAIASRAAGKPVRPFAYWDKGSLATIGRHRAVADLGRLHFDGPLAWLIWLFIHLMYLVGFQNRLLVFVQWAFSYLTFNRKARLITGGVVLPVLRAPRGMEGAPTEDEATASAVKG